VASYQSLRYAERTEARWALAERVAEAVRLRYPSAVLAVWVHGALAHNDDDGGAIELTVVARGRGTGPAPAVRRIDDMIVDLDVIDADACFDLALALTPSWPLAADRFMTGRPLYDPDGWYGRLRDAHLGRLAEGGDAAFTGAARLAWCEASAARARAIQLAEWYDTDGAMHTIGVARLATALVDGLLARTYVRSAADGVSRTGLGAAGLTELADRLATQADELARRGFPVDGEVDDLFR
jgi:hypothetical protein